MNRFINNLKWVMSSQLLVLFASLLRSLVIPKVLSINGFGYWQIYLFYLSYVGIFSLGYNEGIYLAYGAYNYSDLPKTKIRDGNIFHLLVLILFSVLIEFIVIVFFLFNKNFNYFFVYSIIALSIITYGINGVLIYIYQITNRMKLYSFFSIFAKILFSIVVLVSVLSIPLTYEYFIAADFIFTLVTVVLMIFKARELYSINSSLSLKRGASFFWSNIKSGAMLMFAQLSSMLILGIGRFFLQIYASLREFSIYSFGITVTNLLVVLSSSIGAVLYPTISRLNKKKYFLIYDIINNLFDGLLGIIPIFYLVSVFIVKSFLPQFIDVFEYLLLLFIIIYLQIKMQVSINTFLKVMRQEKFLFRINASAILVEFILFIPFIYLNLNGFIVSLITVIVMLGKNYISEIFLSKVMATETGRSFSISKFELILLLILILIGVLFNKSIFVILPISCIYIIITIKKVLQVIRLGRSLNEL